MSLVITVISYVASRVILVLYIQKKVKIYINIIVFYLYIKMKTKLFKE